MSWISAALHGRLTGSGAVFGANDNPLTGALANASAQAGVDAAKIIAKAKADALAAAGQVAQNAVNAVSPGAVIVTPTMMALIAGAALLLLWKTHDG